MHRSDKAPEPSMEEILASIRKIIAEEPIGSRPGPASSTHEDEASSSSLPLSPADDERLGGPPYSVEDALADLMEDSPQRRAPPPGRGELAPKPHSEPVAPPEQAESRPSWLFGRAGGAPAAHPQPAPPPERRREPLTSLRDQLDAMRSLPERAAIDTEPSKAKLESPQKPNETRSLFERSQGAGPSGLANFPTLPSARSEDLPKPAPQRTPPPSVEAKSGNQRGAAGHPSSEAGSRGAPEVPLPPTRGSELGPEPASHVAAPRMQQSIGPATKPPEQPRPAEGQAEEKKWESKPDSPLISGGDLQGEAAAGAEVPPQPAPRVALKPSEPPAAPGTANAQQSAARTLEDTVAELLRPMLREWLDANMPRIVEKALRVELAASAKRPELDGSR